MAQWFSYINLASTKYSRKEKWNHLAMECKGGNTSVINEQVIVQGLLPAEHGARSTKIMKEI